MTELQRKYMAQHRVWMKAREGGLTQEQEGEWADGQERLWWQMSVPEQEELEAMIALDDPIESVLERMGGTPSAPQSLDMVDVVATSGVMPRKPSV